MPDISIRTVADLVVALRDDVVTPNDRRLHRAAAENHDADAIRRAPFPGAAVLHARR